jgi:hypothetical protein
MIGASGPTLGRMNDDGGRGRRAEATMSVFGAGLAILLASLSHKPGRSPSHSHGVLE